jgi:leader peptidase (prepilin peptidase)/N-methyltransferase
MGMGDVKLLAAIGGWLGYQAIIPTIFYGSILGAVGGLAVMVFTKKLTFKTAIPFGPFLAIGAVIHLLVGPYLQELLMVSGLPSN